MTCPQTLEELFETDPKDIDWDGDIYTLNQLLKLPLWSPPAVEVWKLKEGSPDYERRGAPGDWDDVLELLYQLHDEHTRRKSGAD